MDRNELLRSLNFGDRVAEEESNLEKYFIETNQWAKISRGDVDIVYGPKGSGKSALYSLLMKKKNEIGLKEIQLIAGENPRGETAFKALVADPPTQERELIGIWKLYIATLVGRLVERESYQGAAAQSLVQTLSDAGLLKSGSTLRNTLAAIRNLIRRMVTPSAVETEFRVDPVTGQAVGVVGRIVLNSDSITSDSQISIDDLLSLSNEALDFNGQKAWLLLDRLDVAFEESHELEENALRALFKVYLDMRSFDSISLKIFLRDDIWKRITEGGFREASHITRSVMISWDHRSLLHLIVKRAVQHQEILDIYGVSQEVVLANNESQKSFFYRMFPSHVEKGSRRPSTLDWIISRTADGTKKTVPREVIHLLNSTVAKQLDALDIGGYEAESDNLVAGQAFKEALPDVSKVRLEQTIYAEYPSLKPYFERLKGEKTKHTLATLAKIWETDDLKTQSIVKELVSVGFFEERGSKQSPEFWVPFLYRDALDMVQGAADE